MSDGIPLYPMSWAFKPSRARSNSASNNNINGDAQRSTHVRNSREASSTDLGMSSTLPPSSSNKNKVLHTFNYDGLQIQLIRKNFSDGGNSGNHNTEEVQATNDINKAETPSITVEDIQAKLKALIAKNKAEADENDSVHIHDPNNDYSIPSIKFDKKDKADKQKNEIEKPEDIEGAAGLWGRNEDLDCFKENPAETLKTTPAPKSQTNRQQVSVEVILNCGMCKRFIEEFQPINLENCNHIFCRRCLVFALQSNDTAVMYCPYENCDGEIQDHEVRNLLNPDAYDKYIKDQLSRTEDIDLAELHENYDYVEAKRGSKCHICLDEIKNIGDGITLKDCIHDYCKDCLRKYIEATDECAYKCPFLSDDNEHCVGMIMDSEIRSIVTPDIYLRILRKSLAQGEASPNSYHCKTPNCNYFVYLEDGLVQEFDCGICKQKNCILCKTIHQGISCEMSRMIRRNEVDNDATERQVRDELARLIIQPCPRCGVGVQRTVGCPNMQCTRCGTRFIWKT